MLTLDLRRLYRFGWRRQECEYAHKLVRDLVRKIDGQEASLGLYDDIYWDEIPKPGARIETIRLPRPFGSRTPQMDRFVGEIGAARVLPKPWPDIVLNERQHLAWSTRQEVAWWGGQSLARNCAGILKLEGEGT